ncbi:hypothetical protein CPC08DRAFT_703112 [Agrocybe pediades]|nr:hypothetical protein CPC08DRAFT_703112 [Agrocybe pediades]
MIEWNATLIFTLFDGVAPVTSTPHPLPALLSPEDFPALAPSTSEPTLQSTPTLSDAEPSQRSSPSVVNKSAEKALKKAAKKAAAAEKALERQKLAQEKAEAKAAEKKAAKEKALEKEKAEKAALLLKSEQAKSAVQTPSQTEASAVSSVSTAKAEKPKTIPSSQPNPKVASKRANPKPSEAPADPKQSKRPSQPSQPTATKPPAPSDVETQVPLLSKKPKKNKPVVKSVKVHKEEDPQDDINSTVDLSRGANPSPDSSSSNSRSESLDRRQTPTSVQELLAQIDATCPAMDLASHPFFDVQRLTSPAKMPLEYGPLVHALSALSVGGGSFANNMPSGSIDNAVSSFQQLLETLTQTISDLLRLLPRTTWDDSSSFDGVLRDMLKGDDFLDDGEEGPGREDEVAALTLALERRARWMEVQLSKLEELHRDINTAAVRAVLSFNDGGWDRYGFLPRVGNTLHRFDTIGLTVENDQTRFMSIDELEDKLAVAKEAAIFAETEIREAMEKMQSSRLFVHEV